jgi:tetratricopeptide (TPR) repeat protein
MSVRRFGAFLALAAFCLPAAAQRIQEQQDQQAQPGQAAPGAQSTKVVPTIRTHIFERLNEAQICMDEGDLECAQDELDSLENVRDLNNYEIAQLWNFRAFLFFEIEDTDGAIDAYERILAIPHTDMPDGMIQGTMKNLASLYIQEERYQEGLDTFLQWMALPTVTPSADDNYMLASIYYQMERFADGIDPLLRAIELANAAGEIGDEPWYQLLYVFYFQLEQTDKVIETLSFMVEHWTKRDWLIALAGQLSGEGREDETLALYEAAYEIGWLARGTEQVQLANLLLNGDAPYKAAALLDKGLNDGTIESTQSNWRLLAQAYQLSMEHEKALPALERASALADDGSVDRLLAQSYARLARWQECADASRSALDRGGLDRTDYVYMQLGQCLMNTKDYQGARTAFQEAGRGDALAADARRWITFVEDLILRDRTNAELLASLQASN